MSGRTTYPVAVWVVWVVLLPWALLVLGVVLVAMTELGNLPFDNANLWWLGGAVPLAGLCFLYGLARKRRALARFTSARLAPLLTATANPTRQAARAGLVVLAALMLVTAILGPRWGIYMDKQKVRGVDIVVAVDVSRSMLTADVEPNRLARAKLDIRHQLIDRSVFRRANRLGLIAFAGSTSLKVPLTTDHMAFRTQLEALNVGSAPRGGTAIAQAITKAGDLFVRSPKEATKVILLFTDGEDHEGGPVEAAGAAYADHGIKVFTIGVGDAGRAVGGQVPADQAESGKPLLYEGQIVFSKLDVAGLEEIAGAAGGRYAPLRNLHALVNAISSMWKAELTTEERQRHRPRYQIFVAVALALMGFEMLLTERRPTSADAMQRLWQQERT